MNILKKLGNKVMKGMYAHAEGMQQRTIKNYSDVLRQFDINVKNYQISHKKAA